MKVKITHPGLPDGYEITLTGLNATLLNNEDVEVDDEAIAQYENMTGKVFSEVVKGPAFGGPMPKEEKVEEETEPETVATTSTFTANNGAEE